MNNGELIWNRIKDEFPDTRPIRIGFCPYHQSMWDSMESIYEAAENDPDAEATIIPLPYYSLQNNKPYKITFHFEEYQKNFPMELCGKDVLVIHNPYDGNNFVTRTMVFSDVLKSLCKKLVFVPYGMAKNVTLESIIAQAGVFNADMVFAEDDNIRKQIIEIYRPYKDMSNNVFALGCAKEDANQKHYKVPEEWKAIIKDRRVVLYNTSIASMLSDKDKLNKIEQHIREWKRHKEICVIWRPHPLLEDTLVAMRPNLYDKYMRLLHKFGQLENGILDTTFDYHVAMSIADECISDGSSLKLLFEKKLTEE